MRRLWRTASYKWRYHLLTFNILIWVNIGRLVGNWEEQTQTNVVRLFLIRFLLICLKEPENYATIDYSLPLCKAIFLELQTSMRKFLRGTTIATFHPFFDRAKQDCFRFPPFLTLWNIINMNICFKIYTKKIKHIEWQ